MVENLIEYIWNNRPLNDNNIDEIRDYLAAGGNPNDQDFRGNTALMKLGEKNIELAKLLIENGGDLNHVNAKGMTALYYAVHEYDLDYAKFLIENGANVNSIEIDNPSSRSPLMIAFTGEDYNDCANLLLEQGADPNLTDSSGNTALHYAAHSDCDNISLLLLRGADKTLKNNNGQTAKDIAKDYVRQFL